MTQKTKEIEPQGGDNAGLLETSFSGLEKGLVGFAHKRSLKLTACLLAGDWAGVADHLSKLNRMMDLRNTIRKVIDDEKESPAIAIQEVVVESTSQVVTRVGEKEVVKDLSNERVVRDLGIRELGVARALLALDETKAGFLYPGLEEDWKPAAQAVFAGEVDIVGPAERTTVKRAVQSLAVKLPRIEKADKQDESGHHERYRQLMGELRKEAVYKNLKAPTLVRLMRRDRALLDIPQKKGGERKPEVQVKSVKQPESVSEPGKGVVDPTDFAPLGNYHPEALEGIRRGEGDSIVRIHDLRDRQAMIAWVPFLLNGEKSGFRYQNLEGSLDDVFQDKLKECNGDSKQIARMKGMYSCNARESYYSVDRKLLALIELEGAGRFDEVLALSPRLGGFIRDVRVYEGGIYSALNLTDLRRVYRREITAEEILKGSRGALPHVELDPEVQMDGKERYTLTPAEVFMLSCMLISSLPENAGIKVNDKISSKLEEFVHLTDPTAVKGKTDGDAMRKMIEKMKLLLDPEEKVRLFEGNMSKNGNATLAQIAVMSLADATPKSLQLLFKEWEQQVK